MRDVAFTIRPTLAGTATQAKRGLSDLSSLLRDQKTLQDKLRHVEEERVKKSGSESSKLKLAISEVTEKIKEQKEAAEKHRESLSKVAEAAGAVNGKIGAAFAIGAGGASAGFTAAVSLLEKAAEGIKEAFHFAVEKGIELYQEGKKAVQLHARFESEFGHDRAERYERVAKLIGERSGVTGAFAGAALLQAREAMPTYSAGDRVTGALAAQLGMGSRRALNSGDANRLENQMIARRGSLLSNLAILRPDMDPTALGNMVGNVTSGLGMRQFLSEFQLGKRWQNVMSANEAGKLNSSNLSRFGLTTADVNQFGGIHNGRMGTFDLLNMIQEKGGLNARVESEKKSFDFQVRSIKATLNDSFEEIGEEVFKGLHFGLGKGETLAQKLQNALKSPEGKKTIHDIAEGAKNVATAIGDVVKSIPAMIHGFQVAYHAIKPVIDGMGLVGNWMIGGSKQVAKTELAAHAAGTRAAEAVGGTRVGGPLVTLGNLSFHGAMTDPVETVKSLMPHIQNELIAAARRHTAGGASPAAPGL